MGTYNINCTNCDRFSRAGHKCQYCDRKLLKQINAVMGADLVGGEGNPQEEGTVKPKSAPKGKKDEGHRGSNKNKDKDQNKKNEKK
jgi:hypothetical protein